MDGKAVSLPPNFYSVHDANAGVSVLGERRAQPLGRRISHTLARRRIPLDVSDGRGKNSKLNQTPSP
jgi:hypothetical protein